MGYRSPTLVALVLAVSLCAGTPGVAADTQTASLVSMSRSEVTVGAEVVKLGDLFTNTGSKADRVVDDAPAPGAQRHYDVYRLAAIARAHGLTWQAQSWSERVVIERASQTVPAAHVISALQAALQRETAPGERFEVDVAGRDLTLILPVEKSTHTGVENLRLNPVSGQFTATVVAPAGDPGAQRLNVAGRIHRVIDVPMLNKRMANGDIIGREDISWVALRTSAVGRNMITDAERLMGMTPARTAMASRPLMNGDVRAPRLVIKGSMVTMVLKTPHMVLTSKGKALQHGAKGDTIRIMNTQSKTVIEGEVTAAGMVTVTTAAFMPLGLANLSAPSERN